MLRIALLGVLILLLATSWGLTTQPGWLPMAPIMRLRTDLGDSVCWSLWEPGKLLGRCSWRGLGGHPQPGRGAALG